TTEEDSEGDAAGIVDLRVVDYCTPDSQAADQEEGELVRQALLKLPEIYRTVLLLRHYEGLKLGKIAEILEVPEGTVNSRMAEALARLTRILQPQLGGDRMPGPGRTTETNPREILVI